jgi:hypothetical protein
MSNERETLVTLRFKTKGASQPAPSPAAHHTTPRGHDQVFIVGLARAFYWQHLLDSGAMPSGSAIARSEGLHPSTVNELLRLTLLAPDLIEQWMRGAQPAGLNLMWFQRHPLPVDWSAQREVLARLTEVH